jgi:plasmid stabilization system protein ParE
MPDPYRVNITYQASADIESIFEYIRRDSPQNASLVIARVLAAIDDLERMPARFHIAGRSRKRGSVIHARVVRPFIIYYRIDELTHTVFVVEVRHGARRQPKRFE